MSSFQYRQVRFTMRTDDAAFLLAVIEKARCASVLPFQQSALDGIADAISQACKPTVPTPEVPHV